MACYPIILQKQDEDTEKWETVYTAYAKKINKARQTEYFSAGATQSRTRLAFSFAYSAALANVQYDTQHYRLVYVGHTYNIVDYDDFMERHKNVMIVGESYGK